MTITPGTIFIPLLAMILLFAIIAALCTRLRAARQAVLAQALLVTIVAAVNASLTAFSLPDRPAWPMAGVALTALLAGLFLGHRWRSRPPALSSEPDLKTGQSTLPDTVWMMGTGLIIALVVSGGIGLTPVIAHAPVSTATLSIVVPDPATVIAISLTMGMLSLLWLARDSRVGFLGTALLQAGLAIALVMNALDTHLLMPLYALLGLLPALLTEEAVRLLRRRETRAETEAAP
ncbi:hypothetical protein [Granulibacter bethesdensis]|uniref:hypothetical protein n=1 Tax=Granulibacter bethesdensis TaxID=364410 RepID=UPI00046CD141|nr:hypothetical protein [Granulibacter bethesdensis]